MIWGLYASMSRISFVKAPIPSTGRSAAETRWEAKKWKTTIQNHLFEIKHHSRFSKSTITESYTHHVFRDFFFQRHFCSPPVPSTMTTALKKHNDAQKWEVKFDEQNYEDKDQNERTKLKDKIERKKYGGQKWGDKVERQHWKTKLKDKILLGNNLR